MSTIEEKTKLRMAYISLISSIVIGVIGLFIPPQGIIDSSLLYFTAELLVFCSTLLGISISMDNFRNSLNKLRKDDIN